MVSADFRESELISYFPKIINNSVYLILFLALNIQLQLTCGVLAAFTTKWFLENRYFREALRMISWRKSSRFLAVQLKLLGQVSFSL